MYRPVQGQDYQGDDGGQGTHGDYGEGPLHGEHGAGGGDYGGDQQYNEYYEGFISF